MHIYIRVPLSEWQKLSLWSQPQKVKSTKLCPISADIQKVDSSSESKALYSSEKATDICHSLARRHVYHIDHRQKWLSCLLETWLRLRFTFSLLVLYVCEGILFQRKKFSEIRLSYKKVSFCASKHFQKEIEQFHLSVLYYFIQVQFVPQMTKRPFFH